MRFVLAVFATWRVTHLLASEDGPADLIVRLRARLGPSFAGRLMDCFYCLSLWIAVPAAWFVTRNLLDWLMVWLALSGAACLLERVGREPVVMEPVAPPWEGDSYHVLWSEARGVAERAERSGALNEAERAANNTSELSANSAHGGPASGGTSDDPDPDSRGETTSSSAAASPWSDTDRGAFRSGEHSVPRKLTNSSPRSRNWPSL
jgi:hypothetical protein